LSSRQHRRCARNDEDGSVLIGLSIALLVLVLAFGVAISGAGLAAYSAASNAADAAALAAAPVTFRPFGATGSPAREAALYAGRNGATLVSCSCSIDRSWARRTVTVRVIRRLVVPGVGSFDFSATSKATFDPALLIPGPPPTGVTISVR
jgi:hypothetical protein